MWQNKKGSPHTCSHAQGPRETKSRMKGETCPPPKKTKNKQTNRRCVHVPVGERNGSGRGLRRGWAGNGPNLKEGCGWRLAHSANWHKAGQSKRVAAAGSTEVVVDRRSEKKLDVYTQRAKSNLHKSTLALGFSSKKKLHRHQQKVPGQS